MQVCGLVSRFKREISSSPIKLNESKLCIVEVMVVVVRRGDYRVEGLLSLLVFSVFATVDDEIIAKIVGPCVRAKPEALQ